MNRRFLVTVTVTLAYLMSNGQTSFQSWPKMGKEFTDFKLDSVENYSKETISFSDFKGKWIIIDFWGENCSGCIESFPGLNFLQKKYRKDVQFILVTKTYKDPKTAMSLFKKLKNKFQLEIPVSFDQDFVKRVGPDGFPTSVVINPKGIVEAITYKLSDVDIDAFLAGRKPQLLRKHLVSENNPVDKYDLDQPFLIGGNGNNEGAAVNYVYRSIITQWTPSMKSGAEIIERNRWEVLGYDLSSLFRFAYFGKDYLGGAGDTLYENYSYRPILEVKDSSLFQPDYYTGKNIFCYSFSSLHDVYTDSFFNRGSRIADKPKFRKIMQNDLENSFGFKVEIEKRKMPYYKLVATQEARERLRTKGGPEKYEQPDGGKALIAKNIPIKTLRSKITLSAKFPLYTMPVIDETGIDGNIDITIDAIYFDDWLKELRKQGLDLIVGEKEMNMLVIRDIEMKKQIVRKPN